MGERSQPKQFDMIAPETDALDRLCVPMYDKRGKAGDEGGRKNDCVGSKCFAYWRWADHNHILGYCSITGKPEF